MLPLSEVTLSEMDGIPVFAVDGPRPFTAHLAFRVGAYDEKLRDRGITHLVEHLALQPLRDTEISFNGSVASHLTIFTAQGHPDEVGAFLRSACRSIQQLPYERLDVEADVLRREGALRPFSYFESIMWAYYGPEGPGVGAFNEHGLSWLTPDHIEGWAHRYFTRENAAIMIVGDVPEPYGLELPTGTARPYRAPERPKAAPEEATLFDTQQNGVTWGTLTRHPKGQPEPAFFVGLEIVTQRLQSRLRHDLGQTYSVPHGWHRIDADYLAASHGFDCEPERSREVALEHLSVMRDFMEHGPTQEELDRALRIQLKMYEDHPLEAAQHHLYDEAETHLAGWGSTTSMSEYRAQLERTTPGEVAERFVEAYRQSYTIADLPSSELASLAAMRDLTKPPLEGVQFRSKGQYRAQQAGLVRIGPGGISALFAEGWDNTGLDQITLVIADDTGVQLFGHTATHGFEADKYVAGGLVGGRPFRLTLGTLMIALGGYLEFALNAVVVGLVLVFFGLIIFGVSQREENVIRDRRLTMQEAVKKYIPAELVLPEPRKSATGAAESSRTGPGG